MNFIKILGNSVSSTNSFECPHCGKRTLHNKISLTEYSAINDPQDTIGIISAKYLDLIQVTKIVNIAGISHWKCCNCGLTTIRKSDGSIDTIGKKGQ